MKAFAKYCLPVLAAALLAGCGGGGGNDGHGATTPPASGRIQMDAHSLTLPINPTAATPMPGGPFTTEVAITLLGRDGKIISNVDKIDVSINPVSVATFSTLDDPKTTDINEITQRWGQAPVDVVAGKATVFVTSYVNSGKATLTVTVPREGNAANTLAFQSASLVFTVEGAGKTPAVVELTGAAQNAYLASSGGRTQVPLTAVVRSAGGEVLPDTSANNVVFKVLGDDNNGTLKSGSASGREVKAKTVHGVATATFIAGTTQGPITVQAIADGADNDVDNGIAEPVSDTFDVVVSDGKLYSLEITSPIFATRLPGITINQLPVAEGVEPAPGSSIPSNPDATLSLTISALATDRQGNPVLPGTAIRFGSIDEPVWPFETGDTVRDCGPTGQIRNRGNTFQIAGCDGNPQEGGALFTAPTGQFQTAGGGAGPGDALIVFGKRVQGNANLESAVTVSRINSQTSMQVTPNFNLNATTGTSVDYGNILPYIVGRSMHGNVTASAQTNDLGVASAKLTYTVNTVGHAVAVWAQGSGADRVTDAMSITYPGVAPAELIAFPSPIPGNTTFDVTVCLRDAIGIPLRGFEIDYAFELAGGSGSVDGRGATGSLKALTGANGCAIGRVTTSGLPVANQGGVSGVLHFNVGSATAKVDIVAGLAMLTPNRLTACVGGGSAQNAIIGVLASGTGGSPASGVTISASCSGGVTINPASGTTDAGGYVNFTVGGTATTQGSCSFSAPGVSPVTVAVYGMDVAPSAVCAP